MTAETPTQQKFREAAQSLDTLAEATAEAAMGMLDTDGEFNPFFVSVSPNEKSPRIDATPWRNDNEKAMTLRMLQLMFRQRGVIRYAVATGAWLAHYDKRDTPIEDVMTKLPPRDHSDRQEVIAVGAVDKDGTKLFRTYPLIRDGKVVTIGERRDLPEGGGLLGGRMMELLKKESA